MNKFTTSAAPIEVEGFKFTKEIYSGLAKRNTINYDIIDKDVLPSGFGGDYFDGDGQNIKEVLKIGLSIPKYYTGDYSGYDLISFQKPCILLRNTSKSELSYRLSTTTTYSTSSIYDLAVLSLSPLYYNLLSPIFSYPVILEATGYIDPLKANDIMTNRVINSVQLGGRYWVETMAYDLVSGNTKMKLIKLP